MKRILSALALAGVTVSSIAPAVFANFAVPHKWEDAGKTYVYVPVQTPAVAVAGFTAPRAPTTRVLNLNNCGWGSFTKSATSPPTLITGADWAGKTTGLAVTCVKDAAPALTYTSNNMGAVGSVVDDGTKIWIKGGTTIGSATIGITTAGAITTKANACGFVRVTTSVARPMTAFQIGVTDYALADIPTVTAPMICRKVGATSQTYIPAP
jgi:hypothetical protein